MKINIKKNWPLFIVAFGLLIAGGIVSSIGASFLADAMASEAKAQVEAFGRFVSSEYMSLSSYRNQTNAKGTMLLGVGLSTIGGIILGIFFTCKWIRSLIPNKQETK